MNAATKTLSTAALVALVVLPFVSGCGGTGGVGPGDGGGGDTLFVSVATGNDATGDGSMAKPYKTITKALEVSSPGHMILALAGVYGTSTGEVLPLNTRVNVGIAGEELGSTVLELAAGETGIAAGDSCYISKLTIRGDPGRQAVGMVVSGVRTGLNECRLETLNVGVASAARQGCIVDVYDLEFGSCGTGISFYGPTTFVTFGCSFADCDTALVLAGSSFGRAENNAIRDCEYAVRATTVGVVTLARNDFQDCETGISALGAPALGITGNTMADVEHGIDAGTGSGVQITGNTLEGGSSGIAVRGNASAVVDSNTVRLMTGVGLLLTGDAPSDLARRLTRNTVSQCGNGVTLAGTATYMLEGNSVTGNLGRGVWITESAVPDLGGGDQSSAGSNTITGNNLWDLVNDTPLPVKAEGDSWDHDTPGEIDALDIYDDDEDPLSGEVDFVPFQ
jgi:hypothetical protein